MAAEIKIGAAKPVPSVPAKQRRVGQSGVGRDVANGDELPVVVQPIDPGGATLASIPERNKPCRHQGTCTDRNDASRRRAPRLGSSSPVRLRQRKQSGRPHRSAAFPRIGSGLCPATGTGLQGNGCPVLTRYHQTLSKTSCRSEPCFIGAVDGPDAPPFRHQPVVPLRQKGSEPTGQAVGARRRRDVPAARGACPGRRHGQSASPGD